MLPNENSFFRKQISIMLLLLIAVRVVPFGLLHYHNDKFANFEAGISSIDGLVNNSESLIKDSTGSCSIHQLLDIINSGFNVNSILQIITIEFNNDIINSYTENKLEVISINVLNKGSPILA